jgi:hypothetical protein
MAEDRFADPVAFMVNLREILAKNKSWTTRCSGSSTNERASAGEYGERRAPSLRD